jgi:hypothetical protein
MHILPLSCESTCAGTASPTHLAAWLVELADGDHALHTTHTAIKAHIPAGQQHAVNNISQSQFPWHPGIWHNLGVAEQNMNVT